MLLSFKKHMYTTSMLEQSPTTCLNTKEAVQSWKVEDLDKYFLNFFTYFCLFMKCNNPCKTQKGTMFEVYKYLKSTS